MDMQCDVCDYPLYCKVQYQKAELHCGLLWSVSTPHTRTAAAAGGWRGAATVAMLRCCDASPDFLLVGIPSEVMSDYSTSGGYQASQSVTSLAAND
jgi:hypothetical protein